jgi:hypothetical protein
VPHPDADVDWIAMTLAFNRNMLRWLDDPELMRWLDASRLDILGHLRPRFPSDPAAVETTLGPIKTRLKIANAKLESLAAG